MRGKGRNARHARVERTEEEENKRIPRISMDYHFAGTEQNEEGVGTWITMVDSKSGALWTRVVDGKGAQEENRWIISAMNEEIESWGYAGKP